MDRSPVPTRSPRWLAVLGWCAVAAGAGCNGINLGDNPGPDVPKQTGPLTRPPPLDAAKPR